MTDRPTLAEALGAAFLVLLLVVLLYGSWILFSPVLP